ncbi:gas vesicle protein GvpU [Halobacillus kuroshimensis]|uniref:Gas vesicle protein GvpU n=1 Tax=Halobacillus kuroshimensis TaxID=302481 RepID=A0ABS3DVB7_9BACI|nr:MULTISPECIES: gas vesicle accessory protein GvpU [Halobacillus]MBN8235290.1 gas vesicle protein GvpU [Halobacillus kuroshimensis]
MDNVLRKFVKAANMKDFSLDITLNVNGALVTGTTVSAEKYFRSLSGTLAEGNETAQSLSEKLEKASQMNYSQEEIQYIHLENAQVYNGDAQATPAEGSFFWRGRLDRIDGFFLGRIDAK